MHGDAWADGGAPSRSTTNNHSICHLPLDKRCRHTQQGFVLLTFAAFVSLPVQSATILNAARLRVKSEIFNPDVIKVPWKAFSLSGSNATAQWKGGTTVKGNVKIECLTNSEGSHHYILRGLITRYTQGTQNTVTEG